MNFFNSLKKNIIVILVILFISYFIFPHNIWAESMQSSSYKIQTDSLNIGGGGLSSPNYKLDDTVDIINIDNLTQPPVVTPPSGGGGSSGAIIKNPPIMYVDLAPGNPTNVKIKSTVLGIFLSWENPLDEDLDYIRIMRNTDRFYSNPFVGELIYEGKINSFIDSNVTPDNRYFYTLFSRDKIGNYSSGSLIDIRYKLYKNIPNNNPDNTTEITNTTPDEVIEPYIPVPSSEIKPLPNNYIVTQEEFTRNFKVNDVVHLSINKPISVKIKYSPSSANEDMWIEIIDDKNSISKYFFTQSQDAEGFISVDLPMFRIGGYYSVNIYKYNNTTPEIVNQGSFLLDNIPLEKNDINSKYLSPVIAFLQYILSIIIGFISSLVLKISNFFH